MIWTDSQASHSHASQVVWLTAGGPFVISMLIGASTCMFCANLGTNMNFEGAVDQRSPEREQRLWAKKPHETAEFTHSM